MHDLIVTSVAQESPRSQLWDDQTK